MRDLKIFEYEGSSIQFDLVDGKIMANATLMASVFNKKPDDVFKTKAWKEYEIAVIEAKNINSEHIRSLKEGRNGGSWIHEELVVEFARRLNPKFSIWCNDRIAELLRTGKAELPKKSESELILEAFKLLNGKVEQERIEKEHAQKLLVQAQPKVEYYDKVINAEGIFPITLIAHEANMTPRKLNEILKEKKIQRKVNGTWVLAAAYLNKGYAKIKTHPFIDSTGKERTNQQLNWTEKGKEFILKTLGLLGGATG